MMKIEVRTHTLFPSGIFLRRKSHIAGVATKRVMELLNGNGRFRIHVLGERLNLRMCRCIFGLDGFRGR